MRFFNTTFCFDLTAIRSGDYYMFEDVEDEFELDIINQRDSDDEEEKQSATRRRLSKKMNFSQVCFSLTILKVIYVFDDVLINF